MRLYDAINNEHGVIAICTTFVDDPQPLDSYLSNTLGKDPGIQA